MAPPHKQQGPTPLPTILRLDPAPPQVSHPCSHPTQTLEEEKAAMLPAEIDHTDGGHPEQTVERLQRENHLRPSAAEGSLPPVGTHNAMNPPTPSPPFPEPTASPDASLPPFPSTYGFLAKVIPATPTPTFPRTYGTYATPLQKHQGLQDFYLFLTSG